MFFFFVPNCGGLVLTIIKNNLKIMNILRNSVRLLGNIGNEPTITIFGSDQKKVARFSLATHDIYVNEAREKVDKIEWHQIVVWGKRAETVEKYLSKGDKISIEGKLIYITNQKEGINYYNTSIEVREIEFINLNINK